MSIFQEKIAFENRFSQETKQLIVLTSKTTGGASKAGKEKLWIASQRVIAYIDEKTGEFYQSPARLEWQIKETKNKIFDFGGHKIYKVLVRPELSDNKTSNALHYFMLIDLIEENSHQLLNDFLEQYLKPVNLNYRDIIFTLNKEYDEFEANYQFLDKEISIYLNCDDFDNNQEINLNSYLKILDNILNNKKDFDDLCKKFACQELLKDAQNWQEDGEENDLINDNQFIKRISINSISLGNNSFEVFYDDDDIFWGHAIVVYGEILDNFCDINFINATIQG